MDAKDMLYRRWRAVRVLSFVLICLASIAFISEVLLAGAGTDIRGPVVVITGFGLLLPGLLLWNKARNLAVLLREETPDQGDD